MSYGYTASVIGQTLVGFNTLAIMLFAKTINSGSTVLPRILPARHSFHWHRFTLSNERCVSNRRSHWNLNLAMIADKFGRKWAITVVSRSSTGEYESWLLIGIIGQSSVLGIISGAVLAGSTNTAEFLVFRFVAGASAFMIVAAVPVGHQMASTNNSILTFDRYG